MKAFFITFCHCEWSETERGNLNLSFRKVMLLLIPLLLLSCQKEAKKSNVPMPPTGPEVIDSKTETLALTKEILTVLKAKDYTKLANYIHPIYGVRFSPYAYVDTLKNIRLQRAEFLGELQKNEPLRWGEFDGSGEPMILTVKDYFAKFVYNADFLNAEKTAYNEMLGHGNSLNNLTTVYPKSNFTESYFSGFDLKYNGMDWTCLRLVFQNHEGKQYLIAIVHDQWTS